MSNRQPVIPHDAETEAAFIGGCLSFTTRIGDFVEELTPADFYIARHANIWAAMLELHRTGQVVDSVVVLDRLRRQGDDATTGADLVALVTGGLPPRAEHIDIILRHRLSRDLLALCREGVEAVARGAEPAALSQRLAGDLGNVDSPLMPSTRVLRSLPEIITSANDTSPWVIPGLLRTDWRVIIVGAEGKGKSTVGRQIAAMAAQGLHPFKNQPIPPIRALIVDAENPDAAIAETGRMIDTQLRISKGDAYDPSRCMFHTCVGRFDIRSRRDRLEVESLIADFRPNLLCIGPLYQIFTKDSKERDEEATAPVLKILDAWRIRYGCALMMEHHAPKGSHGIRDIEPIGSSILLRWPEIGIALKVDRSNSPDFDNPNLTVGRFRGDRLHNEWPTGLRRASVWPWAGVWDKPGRAAASRPTPEEEMF